MSREKYAIWQYSAEASGMLEFSLRVYGDTLAERHGYQAHEGLEAVQFYLCTKYNWMPSAVRSMSLEDMNFLLAEEMHGWTMPPEAR